MLLFVYFFIRICIYDCIYIFVICICIYDCICIFGICICVRICIHFCIFRELIHQGADQMAGYLAEHYCPTLEQHAEDCPDTLVYPPLCT